MLKASGCVAVTGDDTGSAKASLVDDNAPPLDSLSLREEENHDVNQLILTRGWWYLEWCSGRNRGCATRVPLLIYGLTLLGVSGVESREGCTKKRVRSRCRRWGWRWRHHYA